MNIKRSYIKKLLSEELDKFVSEAVPPISPVSNISQTGDFSGSDKEKNSSNQSSDMFEKILMKAIENEKGGKKEEAATLLKGAARMLQGIE